MIDFGKVKEKLGNKAGRVYLTKDERYLLFSELTKEDYVVAILWFDGGIDYLGIEDLNDRMRKQIREDVIARMK